MGRSGGIAQRHWRARVPVAPRDGRPRRRYWPRPVPVIPRDAKTPQDGGSGPGPIQQPPVCPLNSYAAWSGTGWSCVCNPGFVGALCNLHWPPMCPPHSEPSHNGHGCTCDPGYIMETSQGAQWVCVLQPPPCPLPQCASEGGGSSFGNEPNVPQRPRAQ
jgi:hypothetical protein